MFVPFFKVDSEIQALTKLKVLFLIKKLRNIDISLIFIFVIPFFINFIYYIFLKGKNSPLVLFSPIFSVFSSNSNPEIKEWFTTGLGVFNLIIVAVVVSLRAANSRILYLKMMEYQKNNPAFKWTRTSRFWLMIFVPFLTFSIYPLLNRLTNLEMVHQYNL